MKPNEIILEIEKEQMTRLIEQMHTENASEIIAVIRKHCDIIEQSDSIDYKESESNFTMNRASAQKAAPVIPPPKRRREADRSFAELRFVVVGLEGYAHKDLIRYELTRRGAAVQSISSLAQDGLMERIREADMVILFTEYMAEAEVAQLRQICREEEKLIYTTKQQNIQPLIVGIKNKLKSVL